MQDYLDKNLLNIVDQNDQIIQHQSVVSAHLGQGVRHRAITVFIKNSQNKFLFTQRSLLKPLWPTYWDASFSTHQKIGELSSDCGSRRAFDELGINNLESVNFENLFSYEYHLPWNDVFSEWEINHILIATYDGEINPNSREIMNTKWLSWSQLLEFRESKRELISPWLNIAVDNISQNIRLKTHFN